MEKAKYCVLTCIDYRFQKKIFDWLQKKHMIGESDIIMIAGCSKDIVKPTTQEDYDNVIHQLKTSIALHHPKTVIIADHQDCGGYASDNTIPLGLTYEEDKKLHIEYAKKTKKILNHILKGEKIITYYESFKKDDLEII